MRTVKMTAQQWNKCIREFRYYGCDPYNSADDNIVWLRITSWISDTFGSAS